MINVLDYGFTPDGKTLNTGIFQQLVDECGEKGGGTIIFPPGKYLTGSIELRDNIHIVIEAGAEVLGSTDLDNYKYYEVPAVRFSEDQEGLRTLFYAYNVTNIHFSGTGTINGQGNRIVRPEGVRASMPRVFWFAECVGVTVENLKLRHSGFWMQHYLKCTKLRIHGIDVFNHGSCNNDGCDVDCCNDVIISDCNIDSHDDAICLKSGNNQPTENVVITNCITRTHCNHLKTGTESNGGFRNITVSNMQMTPSTVIESDPNTGGADYRGACGIALGCVDGGMIENISIINIQMDQVRVPFFIKLGDRGIPVSGSTIKQPVQHARAIHLSNIVSTCGGICGGYVMGLPEQPLQNVCIENCDLEFEGGGNNELSDSVVKLKSEAYPACDAFGNFPSFALYMRDIDGIKLNNITCRLLEDDARPAFRWVRVKNLAINNLHQE